MSMNGPAAARLYDEHVDAIYAYVARRLGPGPANEVVGDVFGQALRQQDSERQGNDLGWLLAITTALLRRHGGTERSHLLEWGGVAPLSPQAPSSGDPLLAAGADDATTDAAVVMAAVAELEPADRDLLFLVAWERYPPGVVAEAVGIPAGKVRARLASVRKELKQRVAADAHTTKPVQVVESVRPEVGPMLVTERRHVREQIFDLRMAKRDGAVGVEVNSPDSRRANVARLGALALLGAIGIGGLAYSASRSPDGEDNTTRSSGSQPAPQDTEPALSTIVLPPPPTIAPTTTVAAIAGSLEAPLLLPVPRSRLDDLQVVRKELGGSSALLRAPDLSTVSMREADGLAPPPPPTTEPDAPTTEVVVPPRIFGDVEVTQPGGTGVYDVSVPCGSLQVREGSEHVAYRPEITQLFESMSLVEGSINIVLPPGWDVISIGPSADKFVLGIPIEIAGRAGTVTLTQYPGGSLAVAGFGDQQFAPITFRGQPSWISRNPEAPSEFEIIGMLGTTAFSVRADDIAVIELEAVMATLIAGDIDDWTERFGPLAPGGDPDTRTCQQQPEFKIG